MTYIYICENYNDLHVWPSQYTLFKITLIFKNIFKIKHFILNQWHVVIDKSKTYELTDIQYQIGDCYRHWMTYIIFSITNEFEGAH